MTEKAYWFPRIIYSVNNPTVDADDTKGIIIGQLWKNTNTSERFECIDNTTGAARWYKIIDFIDPNESTVPSYQDEINLACSNGSVLFTPQVLYMNGVIDYDLTIPENNNAMSIGPLDVESVITVLGTWVIV
jgi:hypothetical protein